MKIYFKYEESIKEIYFNNLLIFHGNVENQINLYDTLNDGLHGNSKCFLIDNLPIKKKELNVLEFSMNSILDDLKLTSKSYNLKILESVIDETSDETLHTLNESMKYFELKVMQRYEELSEHYMQIAPQIKFNDMKKVILDNFSLVSKDEVNISLQVELQLMVMINFITLNNDKHYYLLIKHFDHCLDISQMNNLLEVFLKLKNVTVFIFTKSFEVYESMCTSECNYMVNDNSAFKAEFDEQEIHCSSLLLEEEQKELRKILSMKQRYQEYNKIVCEKK